jgi:hypothetical protein
MKNKLNEELKDIKYLFNYNRGRVISEQELFESDKEEFVNYDDMELDEEMDLPVMLPGTKEKERTKVTPGTKPKTPSTPYKPKPGPKPDPKARKRKGDMPTWLTFDELGIDFE